MCSETTAASIGKTGILRHDPMAMLPFCGYNMGDYFQNWIKIGNFLGKKAPKIFHVNWFKTDENGKIVWPGFGENIRVLDWIIRRCENSVNAKTSKIGFLPEIQDINTQGLNINNEKLEWLFEINTELWKKEIPHIEEFYNKIGNSLPQELKNQLEELKTRLQ